MPRFVLLYHDCLPNYVRPPHWDFMLESADMLRTWALEQLPHNWLAAWSRTAAADPRCPSIADGNAVSVALLGGHRLEYLEFEGSLSGERGSVMRVAAGTYSTEYESADRWQITLSGTEISGQLQISRLSSTDPEWTLECWPSS